MWNNPDELRVANNGQVYIAPVGTSLPTTPTAALNAAFVGLGLITEDGVSITVNPDVTDLRSWQSRQPTRRELNTQDVQAVFGLQQWDENTVPFAFGGGAVSGSGPYSVAPPLEGDALTEKALVIDCVDGSEHDRWVFPRGNVTELGEIVYRRNQEAVLPVTFKALEPLAGGVPFTFYTDSTAFAAGS